MTATVRPVVLLAAANDRSASGSFLASLAAEQRGVRDALEAGHRAGRWEVDPRPGITLPEMLSLLRDVEYASRVAILHYAGHASPDALFLESDVADPAIAHAAGLAALLGELPRLRLVFLNGCETRDQVPRLLDAGVPAIIATDARIADTVATQFAIDVYRALVDGQTVGGAFRFAESAARTRSGDTPRGAFRDMVLEETQEVDWPWALHSAGAHVDNWTLGDVLDRPLAASRVRTRLPDRPYRHLLPFTRDEAALFFGRGADLRALVDAVIDPQAPPLALLFGGAGTGKSSLLNAGLLTALVDRADARYARRDAAHGLSATLRALLDLAPHASRDDVARTTTNAKRARVLIIDQVEEAITRASGDPRAELNAFADDLRFLLATDASPVRVVLGFRKEWLAEIQAALSGLWSSSQFLDRLNERSIVEAIRGPADEPGLARLYRLEIEKGLAETIAGDLLADPHAPVAPTLQVLLARMWDAAPVRPDGRRVFDTELYNVLRREGLLLGDFLDQQLAALGRALPDAVITGFALDVLHAHTTSIGTAEACSASWLEERFAAAGERLTKLTRVCTDLFLLTTTDAHDGGAALTRLVHDTLAPLVRERFDQSDAPAQRARRLLELRTREFRLLGSPLTLDDLAIIEAGLPAMRAPLEDERALLEQGRNSRRVANAVRRAANMRDPVQAAELLVTLRGESEPPSGSAIAARVAANSFPIVELQHGDGAERVFVAFGRSVADPGFADIRRLYEMAADQDVASIIGAGLMNVQTVFNAAGTHVLTTLPHIMKLARLDGTGEPVVMRHGFEAGVSAIIDAEGRRVATLAPGRIQLWDAAAPDSPRDLPHTREVRKLPLFSPDGEWLLTVMESVNASAEKGVKSDDALDRDAEYVCLWRTSDLSQARMIRADYVYFMEFLPDSQRFLVFDGRCTIHECVTDATQEVPFGDGFHEARFSPDGRFIAINGGGNDVIIQSLETPGATTRLRNNAFVSSIVYSPDGRQIAAVMDNVVKVWPSTGEFHLSSTETTTLLLYHAGIRAVRFSADGQYIVTSGEGVRIWHNRKPAEPVSVWTPTLDLPFTYATISPDARHLVSAAGAAVHVWNATTGSWKRTIEPLAQPLPPEFVSEELFALADAHGLRIEDVHGSPPRWLDRGTRPDGITTHPQSDRLLAWYSRHVMVWHIRAAEPLRFDVPDPIRFAEFGAAGTRIVIATEDTVHIHDIERGGDPVILHTQASMARLSTDGTLLLTRTYQGEVYLCNADGSGDARLLAHGEHVHDANFSADGKQIVTGTRRSGHIWVTDGRGELLVIRNEDEAMTAMFSPDGTHVCLAPPATWGPGVVRIWRADGSGDPVQLMHPQGVATCRFSDDGSRVVTGCADGCARVWRVDWNELLDFLATQTAEVIRP